MISQKTSTGDDTEEWVFDTRNDWQVQSTCFDHELAAVQCPLLPLGGWGTVKPQDRITTVDVLASNDRRGFTGWPARTVIKGGVVHKPLLPEELRICSTLHCVGAIKVISSVIESMLDSPGYCQKASPHTPVAPAFCSWTKAHLATLLATRQSALNLKQAADQAKLNADERAYASEINRQIAVDERAANLAESTRERVINADEAKREATLNAQEVAREKQINAKRLADATAARASADSSCKSGCRSWCITRCSAVTAEQSAAWVDPHNVIRTPVT